MTAQGVLLDMPRADIGERVVAIVLDLFFMSFLMGMIVFAVWLAEEQGAGDTADAFGFLILMLLRLFFFVTVEVVMKGRTPGKAIMSLRVVDRLGGTLTLKALIARNLSREVELFIPLLLLFELMVADMNDSEPVGLLSYVAFMVWMSAFVFFPFFNRDRLRLGDLIAGTMVVSQVDQALLPDPFDEANEPGYRFTRDQLDIYGLLELEHLAKALRSSPDYRTSVLPELATRIAAKIEWPNAIPPEQAEAFLRTYYQSLRAHLEQRALFGKRRLTKHDEPN
ncbi:MAG: RDD family protein [Geminicoccaceae bacterium]